MARVDRQYLLTAAQMAQFVLDGYLLFDAFDLDDELRSLLKPGEMVEVAVVVRNGSRSWLSSGFPHQPVNVSYRWVDGSGAPMGIEGRRTGFPEPLAPGRSARLAVAVELPTAPGRYTLVLTLVQERFAWLDDLDAGCTAHLPATVAATTPTV